MIRPSGLKIKSLKKEFPKKSFLTKKLSFYVEIKVFD
jgi:hypothetical protein